MTEEQKAKRRARQAKYRTTEKGKISAKKYFASEKGRATIARLEAKSARIMMKKLLYQTPEYRLIQKLRMNREVA